MYIKVEKPTCHGTGYSGNMEEFLKILIYDDAKIASILSLKAATDQRPIARRQVLVHIATVK